MFCFKPPRKKLAFPPDFLLGEEILRKWTVSADFWAICPKNFLIRKSGGKASILRSEPIYINDLYRVSNILKPIMFADDTNLFCLEKHIKTLFQTANIELEKIAIWFQATLLK